MALRRLVAGSESDDRIDRLVDAHRRNLSAAAKGSGLWWACDGETIRAVAAVSVSKGKVAFLYPSPVGATGVDETAMSELISYVSGRALACGAGMVQAMIDPEAGKDIAVLLKGGLEELAELIFLHRGLENLPEMPDLSAWSFCPYLECGRKKLAEVIRLTYQDTLDCPRLVGRRTMNDVVASHQTTGCYWPIWWWRVEARGVPAGCVLVNRAPAADGAEVVYMGVAPSFRGRGLGWAMLCFAAHRARADGARSLRLAVDAGNSYARDLYERFGFRATHRRLCLAAFSMKRGGV